MSVYTRRGLLFLLVTTLVACSGIGQGGTTPPLAYNQPATAQSTLDAALDSAPLAAGGREVIQKLTIHPQAGLPAILMNFVSNGPAQGGVPCITCVSGASSSDNVGLTGPSSYVRTGAEWQYALSYTDISYKGSCKLAWAITSGKKTIDSFSATLKLKSAGGFVLYAINRTRPKYSGPATLTGKVTCGKNVQSTQAPLQFE